jgi:hypothetical protein
MTISAMSPDQYPLDGVFNTPPEPSLLNLFDPANVSWLVFDVVPSKVLLL